MVVGRSDICRNLFSDWKIPLYTDEEFDHFDKQKAFLEKVLNENPGLPCFCFGHSTGAAITLKVINTFFDKRRLLQLLVRGKAQEV